MKILSSLLQTQATVHLLAVLWIRICPDPYSMTHPDPDLESRSIFRIRIHIKNPDPYFESGSVFGIRISTVFNFQALIHKKWIRIHKKTGYIKNYYGSGYESRSGYKSGYIKKEYGSPTLPVRNRQKILLNIY